MDVKGIVDRHLRQWGYDGLVCDGCGCEMDDLFACGEDFSACEPAVKSEPTNEERMEGHEFMMKTLPKYYSAGGAELHVEDVVSVTIAGLGVERGLVKVSEGEIGLYIPSQGFMSAKVEAQRADITVEK